jgi:uroporphyrinogen-III synthase
MKDPVLLIRSAGNEEDAAALSAVGLDSIIDPYLCIKTSKNTDDAKSLLSNLQEAPTPVWLVATSVNAIERWAEIVGIDALTNAIGNRKDLRFAAIGEKTALTLKKYGAEEVLVPEEANAEYLVDTLLKHEKANIILPAGNIAMNTLPNELQKTGWQVTRGVVYETEIVKTPPMSVKLLAEQKISAVIFRSPSSVRAFFHFVDQVEIPLICAGGTTARQLTELNKKCDIISVDPTPKAVAAATLSILGER